MFPEVSFPVATRRLPGCDRYWVMDHGRLGNLIPAYLNAVGLARLGDQELVCLCLIYFRVTLADCIILRWLVFWLWWGQYSSSKCTKTEWKLCHTAGDWSIGAWSYKCINHNVHEFSNCYGNAWQMLYLTDLSKSGRWKFSPAKKTSSWRKKNVSWQNYTSHSYSRK